MPVTDIVRKVLESTRRGEKSRTRVAASEVAQDTRLLKELCASPEEEATVELELHTFFH